MRDTELYRRILGIEAPWEIDEVDLDTAGREVRVHLIHHEPLSCPECGRPARRYDSRLRSWRHLDTCQYQTLLVAEVPRVECAEHGVKQVRVPWGEAGSRFTALMEALMIDWLREATPSAVARQFGVSWGAVRRVMARAVRRGLLRRERRLPAELGVDEVSFQKRHEYVTVVLDRSAAPGSGVVYLADGRGRDTLDKFLEGFKLKDRKAVTSVTMDMHAPYIASVSEHIPGAESKIAFDKFHVAQHLGDAVNKVRRAEHKCLSAQGDERLKGTRFHWLRHPQDLPDDQQERFAVLCSSALKTLRAWALKELGMSLWDYTTRGWARRAWLRWYAWAIRSQLEPVRKVARMVKRHLEGILNAIALGVTNARSEAVNAKIKWIKKSSRGFRSRESFREAIFFHLGGLDLYPEGLRK